MYIEPNSTLYILYNVPLDTTYDHTIYFDREKPTVGKQQQFETFFAKRKYEYTKMSYQRVNKRTIRVAFKADDLYDCNYLMFQNTNFGSKWFYAFIEKVEYVNNVTSEITYTIDVMQTWMFDYELGMSLIDREHSKTDEIGENLVPEQLDIGDYISTRLDMTASRQYYITIAATFDEEYKYIQGGLVGGVYQGLMFHSFPNTEAGAEAATDFLDKAVQYADLSGVVAVFLSPISFAKDAPLPVAIAIEKFYGIKRTNGNAPRNNKCLTAPYTQLYVTTNNGQSATYQYEYFNNDSNYLIFNELYGISANPEMLLVPTNYKGVDKNYDEKMCLTGFPQLSWNADSFKAWLAMNASNLAILGLSAAVALPVVTTTGLAGSLATFSAMNTGVPQIAGSTSAVTSLTGGSAVGLGSAVTGALKLLSTGLQSILTPPQAHGSTNTAIALASSKLIGFDYYYKYIRPEFVDIVDDFFTMYGYACHRVKQPNTHVRKGFTYTKTMGCVIHGSIPCDDMAMIAKIFDHGITFWNRIGDVGYYDIDNSPLEVS